jgi:hypothetical protein
VGSVKRAFGLKLPAVLMTVLKCLAAPSTGAKLQLNHQEAIMAAQSKRASAQNVSPVLKCRPGDLEESETDELSLTQGRPA